MSAKRKADGATDEAPALVFAHDKAQLHALDEGPLAGLRHRTVIDHEGGSRMLALWQEEHDSGFQVPEHYHDCEEIITVLEGTIEATVAGSRKQVKPLQSILIPARLLHGFAVTTNGPVRLLGIFGSSAPKIFRADGTESQPPWCGGASDHLEIRPAPTGASDRPSVPI